MVKLAYGSDLSMFQYTREISDYASPVYHSLGDEVEGTACTPGACCAPHPVHVVF